jgi:hypothetical protein
MSLTDVVQRDGQLHGFIAGTAMLRITVVDTPSEEKWILQGQLTGEFASELSANWRTALDRCSDRLRLVDLNEVTQIDKWGEEVLLQMMQQNARFVASGLYNRHLLQELQSRTQAGAQKPAD